MAHMEAETLSIYLTGDVREGVEAYAERLRAADGDRRGSRSRAVRQILREGLRALNRMELVK